MVEWIGAGYLQMYISGFVRAWVLRDTSKQLQKASRSRETINFDLNNKNQLS